MTIINNLRLILVVFRFNHYRTFVLFLQLT
nr:MAG TPA: hypothetical protein [Caudoviricetes sp.]DAZ32400.1 MAG TPA: hypothetical protein [Caudoviricetes sp.]